MHPADLHQALRPLLPELQTQLLGGCHPDPLRQLDIQVSAKPSGIVTLTVRAAHGGARWGRTASVDLHPLWCGDHLELRADAPEYAISAT